MNLFLVILFFSCTTKEASFQERFSGQTEILYTSVADHVFSSTDVKDHFVLTLTGKDNLNGKVRFQIFSYSNKCIYFEEFEAKALLDYGVRSNATDEEKSAYIIKRMNDFFHERNFVKPAIATEDLYDEDYNKVVSKSAWHGLKQQNTIGFYYLLWEGDQSWIMFSKAANEVVKYKKCC